MRLVMINFFQPSSKVQKDRRIMRATDTRLAKYSRRGLVFNFVAFLVCLIGGRFFDENKDLTIILTIGLLLVTMLRGFFLFRFDSLYPRAPTKWRNSYFIATLLGAMWWGTILVCIILKLGFTDEAPLILLYTVVFFSSTAHAFAPYQKFLSYYQFFGIIPAASASFWLNDVTASIYGFLLLCYYLILTHQCRLISENYWEKLEATFALSQKAFMVEEEKKESRAILQLSKEFLEHLDNRLYTDISGDLKIKQVVASGHTEKKIASVIQSVHDFKNIVFKNIIIANTVFNIRHELQYLVSEYIVEAEAKGIQIETSLSPTLPMRLKGDPERFAQIIKTLLQLFLDYTEDCALLIEVQFLREYEKAGELYVTFREIKNNKQGFFSAQKQRKAKQSLALIVAKGLADSMSGNIENIERSKDDDEFHFNARLDLADVGGQLDFHRGRFQGKSILLVHSNPSLVDIKRQELDALGFTVTTETQHKRAKSLLSQSIKQGNAIENIIFYHEDGNEPYGVFLKELVLADDLRYINKIIAATSEQQKQLIDMKIDDGRGFFFVSKPVGLFELESTFDFIFNSEPADTKVDNSNRSSVLVFTANPISDVKISQEIEGLTWPLVTVSDINHIEKVLPNICAVIIPCNINQDISSVITKIRDLEPSASTDYEYLPVLGIGNGCDESEICAFEVGLDDYINLASNTSKSLVSSLTYWHSLQSNSK